MTSPIGDCRVLFVCFVLTVSACFLSCQKVRKIEPTFPDELPKKDRIDLAIAQEVEMTKDPATGQVPKERLFRAYKVLQARKANMVETYSVSWNERGPDNVGGRTRALLIDQNDATYETVWAGSVGGGLWKCTNISSATPNWAPINDFFDNMAITCIAQDPSNPDHIYFGTGEGWFNADAIRGLGIWKSTNGGSTWSQLASTNNSSFHYNQKIVIDSSGNMMVATRNAGVQRSTDGGSSWTKVLGINNGASTNRAADLEIAANGDIYAGMGIFSEDGVYKSTDGGINWSKLTNGLPSTGYQRVEIACAPSDSDRVYVLFQDAATYDCYGIYKSTDGGSSFTSVSNPQICTNNQNFCRGQAWYDLTAAVDPNDQERLFIGGVDLLVSSDGGSNFSQVSQWFGGCHPYVHADHHIIVFEPGSSDNILFGSDGGVFRTTNGSSSSISFTSKNDGYNVTQFYGCAMHPGAGVNHFLAGSQDNGSHRFDQTGVNSTTEVTGGDGAFCNIDQDQSSYQFTQYVYSNYYRSTNGGSSFSSIFFNNNGRFINPSDYDDTENKLYAAYTSGTYFRWDDPQTGTTAYSISISDFNNSKVSAVTCSPNSNNRVFFGLGNGDVVKIDSAHSGSPVSTIIRSGSNYVSCIAVEDGNDNHIIVTYSNYGVNSVYETTDGGTTWNSIEGDLPDMPVRWALFNPHDADEALLATETGVWYSDNLDGSNTHWIPVTNGMAEVRTDMLQIRSSDNEIIASTHGRGLFSTSSFEFNLPVEWLSFVAEEQEGDALLKWATTHEYNNEGFEVQRSEDARQFDSIGWVEGSNAPYEVTHYTFSDQSLPPISKNWYYRLRQIDRDGSESYSPVRHMQITAQAMDLAVYPNPASHTLFIDAKEAGNLIIYDVQGREVYSNNVSKGMTLQIPTTSWQQGVYYIKVNVANKEYMRKILVSQ